MEDFLENNLREMEAGFCFIRIFAIRIKETISMNQQYPSVLLEKAVGEFAKLPGIGRKTAMRLDYLSIESDEPTKARMVLQMKNHEENVLKQLVKIVNN